MFLNIILFESENILAGLNFVCVFLGLDKVQPYTTQVLFKYSKLLN